MKKRLDLFLVEQGYFETREKAKREIMIGNVIINEQAVTKAGTMVKDDDENLTVRIKERLKYVSRGGLKLERAIEYWDLKFEDAVVLDVGSSTGGFTDCALQSGAAYVYATDVGKNQLDWKLRTNEKVKSIEEKHIKDLTLEDIDNKKVDYIVIDVSFISLTNVLQYLEEFLKDSGKIITLIKPQFEVGREKIGRNGIVTNPEYHDEAIKKVIKYADSKNFKLIDITDSPISGAKGNKEFLGLFSIKK
ncbi:MAG: TlyA family RNA methyltransferase [Sebaldella sp.]|nr:TlyA family RNA methyltransferase [Sebaldella sp.]